MNIEDVRVLALAQPGVTEDMPFGDDVVTFRIEGKIFLCLWLAAEEPRFALKLPPERNEQLRLEHGSITPAWHWNKKHWSDVYYSLMDNTFVKGLIQESYSLVLSGLPKYLRERHNKILHSTTTHTQESTC